MNSLEGLERAPFSLITNRLPLSDVISLSLVSHAMYDKTYSAFEKAIGCTNESLAILESLVHEFYANVVNAEPVFGVKPWSTVRNHSYGRYRRFTLLCKVIASIWNTDQAGNIIKHLFGRSPLPTLATQQHADLCKLLLTIPNKEQHGNNDVLLFLKCAETYDSSLIEKAFAAIPLTREFAIPSKSSLDLIACKIAWELFSRRACEDPTHPLLKQDQQMRICRFKTLVACVLKEEKQNQLNAMGRLIVLHNYNQNPLAEAQAASHRIIEEEKVHHQIIYEEHGRLVQQLKVSVDTNKAFVHKTGQVQEIPAHLYCRLRELEDAVDFFDVSKIDTVWNTIITAYVPTFAFTVFCMVGRLYSKLVFRTSDCPSSAMFTSKFAAFKKILEENKQDKHPLLKAAEKLVYLLEDQKKFYKCTELHSNANSYFPGFAELQAQSILPADVGVDLEQ